MRCFFFLRIKNIIKLSEDQLDTRRSNPLQAKNLAEKTAKVIEEVIKTRKMEAARKRAEKQQKKTKEKVTKTSEGDSSLSAREVRRSKKKTNVASAAATAADESAATSADKSAAAAHKLPAVAVNSARKDDVLASAENIEEEIDIEESEPDDVDGIGEESEIEMTDDEM